MGLRSVTTGGSGATTPGSTVVEGSGCGTGLGVGLLLDVGSEVVGLVGVGSEVVGSLMGSSPEVVGSDVGSEVGSEVVVL